MRAAKAFSFLLFFSQFDKIGTRFYSNIKMDHPNMAKEGEKGGNRKIHLQRRAKRTRKRNNEAYESSTLEERYVKDEQTPNITDEEAYRKGFNENQGIYLVLGAQYKRSSKKLDKVYWTLFVCCLAVDWFCLLRAILLLFDDLQLLFEVTHWWLIANAVMLLPHMAPKENYDRIFTYLGKGVYIYKILDEETAEKVKEIRVRRHKEVTFLSKGFSLTLLGTIFGFMVLMPLMSIISGEFAKPQLSNGILTGIPAVLWIPVKISDDDVILARIIMLIIQGYLSFVIINAVIGQQTTSLCFGHTLYYEFQILALTFERFEKRARSMNKKAEPGVMNSERNELEKCILMCLKDSIQHHKVLLTMVEDYIRIFSRQELVTLVTSTLIICLSAISVTSDIQLGAKLVAVVFVGAELVNVFVVCYCGQVLVDAHEIVQDAVYSSSWPSYNSRPLRQYILIILTRLRKQLKISAAGFVPVNLDTFAQVVKTAFSYFSLLQALKE